MHCKKNKNVGCESLLLHNDCAVVPFSWENHPHAAKCMQVTVV